VFFSYRQVAVLRASHRGTDFRPRIFRGFSLLILPAPNRIGFVFFSTRSIFLLLLPRTISFSLLATTG